MPDVMVHEFLLGFLKLYILQCAAQEPIFGKEIHDQLEMYGYRISYGTLYHTFHEFEKKGYLTHEERNVNGKIRKYYTVTKRGKEALAEARAKAKDLITSIYG